MNPSRPPRTDEREEKIDLTSMIDVTFLLLVFFLCATEFRQPEEELSTWLPTERGVGERRSSVDPGCRITIERHGDAIVLRRDGGGPVPFRARDDRAGDVAAAQAEAEERAGWTGPDFKVLREELRTRRENYVGGGPRGLPVTLDVGGDVPALYAVAVVDLCKELGIEEIIFAEPERFE